MTFYMPQPGDLTYWVAREDMNAPPLRVTFPDFDIGLYKSITNPVLIVAVNKDKLRQEDQHYFWSVYILDAKGQVCRTAYDVKMHASNGIQGFCEYVPVHEVQ